MSPATARTLPGGASFRWTVPPAVLAKNLATYVQRLIKAIGNLADLFAVKMLAYAKQIAPWNDRTGDARAGLSVKVIKTTIAVMIILHTGPVPYTIYLEFGHMNARGGGFTHAYPAIFPTLEAHYGQIMAALQQLMKGR